MSQRQRLSFDQLEDRQVPATFGVPWSDAQHLTLSFVPDGTAIAGHQSDLFATMNAQRPTMAWEREILRALQTWAVQANVNVGIVPDGGQPLGAAGPKQGDTRFGDVRIAAQLMSSSALAVSVPHDPFTAGTWAGDVFFNSAYNFTNPQADLFSVALHEFGHVLGLDNGVDPKSVMFPRLNKPLTGLAKVDVTALQALYGARAPDQWDANKANDTFKRATQIKGDSEDGTLPLVVYGDVTTNKDVDYYAFRAVDDYRGPVTIRLQSAGISLLAPKLTVTDASGRFVLGQAQSTNPLGDVVTVTLPHVTKGATYYVRVEGASKDVFGIGRYGMAVTFDDLLTTPRDRVDAALRGPYEGLDDHELTDLLHNPDGVLVNEDGHGDDNVNQAAKVAGANGYAPNSHYQVLGSLSDGTDVDTYRLRAAKPKKNDPLVLTATVTALDANGTVPAVQVFDRDGQPGQVQILANGNGSYVVQMTGIKPGADYYVQVKQNPTGKPTGNYVLEVDFSKQAASLKTFAVDALNATTTTRTGNLYVAQNQLFQFTLSAQSAAAPADAGVRFTITDDQGNQVYSLLAKAGETVSGATLFLVPGTYHVDVAIEGAGNAHPAFDFQLKGARISDPVGPALKDATLAPQFTVPNDPTIYQYPGGVISKETFLLLLTAV